MSNSVTTWNEGASGIATSTDPQLGGIIDKAIVSGEWFVIFNSDQLESLEGFKTRAEAFAAHEAAIRATYWLA